MANRIKELRKEKKITQLQLSLALDVTQETISSYEHGRHLPSLSALMRMSKIFDASMDYIMCMSDVRYMVDESDSNAADTTQRTLLLNCYRKLGSKNKARLIAYAQGLIDSEIG